MVVISNRFFRVWRFFLPLAWSVCSAESVGRGMGRSVPSWQKGGAWSRWHQVVRRYHELLGCLQSLALGLS